MVSEMLHAWGGSFFCLFWDVLLGFQWSWLGCFYGWDFQIVMMRRKESSVIDIWLVILGSFIFVFSVRYLFGQVICIFPLLSFLLLMDLLGPLGSLQELKIAWCAMVIPLDSNLYMYKCFCLFSLLLVFGFLLDLCYFYWEVNKSLRVSMTHILGILLLVYFSLLYTSTHVLVRSSLLGLISLYCSILF